MFIKRASGLFAPRGGGGTAYRYFRLSVSDANDANFMIVETFYLSPDGGATKYPNSIGTMTSNSAPSPLVASASSENDASYAAWKAFDNNSTNRWQSTLGGEEPSWLKIDLGAGNEIAPNHAYIESLSAYHAVDFKIEGSNTGAFSGEEEVLQNITGNTTTDLTLDW